MSSKWKTICWLGGGGIVFCIAHLLKISTITGEPIFSLKNLRYLGLFLVIVVPVAIMWNGDEEQEEKTETDDD